MLRLALVFLLVSILAAIFGFPGISGTSYEFARILFFIFVVLFAVSFLFGLLNRGGPNLPPI